MWRPGLGDFLAVAGVVLELPSEQLRRLANLQLAESALAAPFAEFGGHEAHPTVERKTAVLHEGTSEPPVSGGRGEGYHGSDGSSAEEARCRRPG